MHLQLVTATTPSRGPAWTAILDLRDTTRSAILASPRTHHAIAQAADCTKPTVDRLAEGTTREPRASTCIKILHALGYTIVAVPPKGVVR